MLPLDWTPSAALLYAENRESVELTALDRAAIATHEAMLVIPRFAQIGLGKELTAAVARHGFLWEGAPPQRPPAEAIS